VQDNDAIISDDGQYRYALSRLVQTTGPKLLWVMLNPSTANAAVDDATIRKCLGFSRKWGIGSFRVVNLFALRSKDKTALWTGTEIIGPENDRHIDVMARWADQIVCAWGAKEKIPPRYRESRPARVMELLQTSTKNRGIPVFSLGTTRGGDPLHPLMVPYAAERQEYR